MDLSKSLYGEFARRLWDSGEIELESVPGEGFELRLHQDRPNEPLSPYKIHIRTPDNPKPGNATPELLYYIAEMFYRSTIGPLRWKFDEIAGPPNAGVPIAEALAKYMEAEHGKRCGLVPLEKTTRPDGSRFISGIEETYDVRGKRVLIVDNAITEGTTVIPTIKILTMAGARVQHVIVAVDREQGAAYRIAEATNWRTDLWSIVNARQLFTFLYQNGRISHTALERVRAYHRATSRPKVLLHKTAAYV